MFNVHFMDKLNIKPLDTQATVVGKCRQTHDVSIVKKGCSNSRAAGGDKCLIYSGYLSAYYGACTFTPNGNVRTRGLFLSNRYIITSVNKVSQRYKKKIKKTNNGKQMD